MLSLSGGNSLGVDDAVDVAVAVAVDDAGCYVEVAFKALSHTAHFWERARARENSFESKSKQCFFKSTACACMCVCVWVC